MLHSLGIHAFCLHPVCFFGNKLLAPPERGQNYGRRSRRALQRLLSGAGRLWVPLQPAWAFLQRSGSHSFCLEGEVRKTSLRSQPWAPCSWGALTQRGPGSKSSNLDFLGSLTWINLFVEGRREKNSHSSSELPWRRGAMQHVQNFLFCNLSLPLPNSHAVPGHTPAGGQQREQKETNKGSFLLALAGSTKRFRVSKGAGRPPGSFRSVLSLCLQKQCAAEVLAC